MKVSPESGAVKPVINGFSDIADARYSRALQLDPKVNF